MQFRIINTLCTGDVVRLVKLGGHEVIDRDLLFNGGPYDYRNKLYAIYEPLGNFSHCLCILWSEDEHTVLDDAVNANLLDSLLVPEGEETEDHARLGDASEPFDLTDISIVRIPDKVWQDDWKFCYALGQADGDASQYETGADI